MPRDIQPRQKLVVIGNGMAGIRAVEEILAREPNVYDITVFGAEPHVNYNRILLSPVLAGEKSFQDIILNDRDWYAANNITLFTGEKVTAIHRDAGLISTEAGRSLAYDKLLLATGSDPIIIPVPGHKLPGVIAFRDLSDVDSMLAAASKPGARAVVIGGGLLGLEAANGLASRGMHVTVLHLMDWVMERQLDSAAGHLLQQELTRRGIEIITKANTDAIIGEGKVEAVVLKDGRTLPADLVVMAVGIKPNAGLAKQAGIHVERGIVVDDAMRTSDPAILAVGECAQHRGICYGLVAPLWDMAKTVADTLCDRNNPGYAGSVTATKLKVTGIDLYSAGSFNEPDADDIVFRDAARGIYKRIIVKDDKVAGAVLYGDTGDGPWYFQLLKDGTDIGPIRDTLIFGAGFEGGGANPKSAVASLPDNAEICGCNGVCKGTITKAITDKGLTSLDEVRSHTKASASCGSCTGQVEQLLALTLGDAFDVAPKTKPMCKCTHHGHDEVRRRIATQALKTMPAIMQALEWTTPDGCSSCRPALNYYLLSAWPGEYVDDNQSRFINERVHANIQKDGTYSVVPRMWGGLTSAKELRAIADVVDKFDIPTVKVTGGQRIDLLGVKKDDLPAVWADLNAAGMVSGHAYAKALRTVKTCVGSEWCRFGTQDSTGMGVKLERLSWGSWMPHKFKMAVSGCPRNCAEATIKDFGVVAVDSGWELHVGGNGGIKIRATDFLAKVTTEDEVLEYAGAFIQMYREQARYLERTAPWIERVGIELIRQAIVEDAGGRARFYARFLHSQEFSQDDPWAARGAGTVDRHEYQPLLEKVG